MQIARNLTDTEDGFLRSIRYLILDRDPLYTRAFRAMLKDSDVEALRLPARSPNLNGYASYCTSSVRSGVNSGWTRLSESLFPCFLQGGFGPGWG